MYMTSIITIVTKNKYFSEDKEVLTLIRMEMNIDYLNP